MKARKSSYRMYKFRQNSVPYLFLLPNMLIFLIYIIIPAIVGIYYSFTKFDGLYDPVFVGFANYEKLLGDAKFHQALINTMKYVAVSVPLVYIISLALGILIIQEIRAKGFFRAVYYWPVMISFVVVGVMWQWILGDKFGVFNQFMQFIGIDGLKTLTDTTFTWWAAVFIMVWSKAGYFMIIFMGGLLSIPPTIYEAAKIDGATKVQTFFRVTLPMLKPTSLLVIVLSTMQIFKVYPMMVTFTGGGPFKTTRFLVQHVYEMAFDSNKFGYASAMSVIMLIIVMAFSGLNIALNRGGDK